MFWTTPTLHFWLCVPYCLRRPEPQEEKGGRLSGGTLRDRANGYLPLQNNNDAIAHPIAEQALSGFISQQ